MRQQWQSTTRWRRFETSKMRTRANSRSLLEAGGLFSPVIAVLAALKGLVDISGVKARIWTAIHSLCDELERIRDRWPADAESALEFSMVQKSCPSIDGRELARAKRGKSHPAREGNRARLLAQAVRTSTDKRIWLAIFAIWPAGGRRSDAKALAGCLQGRTQKRSEFA